LLIHVQVSTEKKIIPRRQAVTENNNKKTFKNGQKTTSTFLFVAKTEKATTLFGLFSL
jgi:hypothetical protein